MNQATSEIQRYLENWQDEIESAFLYRSLSKAEHQPALAEVYRQLADTEENHAQFWCEKFTQRRLWYFFNKLLAVLNRTYATGTKYRLVVGL